MTVYSGGLRLRLIRESLYQMIHDALDDLHWFDSGRQHRPVTFLPGLVPDYDKVEANTAALADLDMVESDIEMGSLLAEHNWRIYVDFFGENDAVGTHFIHDVRAIVGGRMPEVGRSDPSFVVYDYTMATPAELFTCEIEGIMVDRPTTFERQFQRHWFTCRFDVLDFYGRSDD